MKANVSFKELTGPYGQPLGSVVSAVQIEAADADEFAQVATIVAQRIPRYAGAVNVAQPVAQGEIVAG